MSTARTIIYAAVVAWFCVFGLSSASGYVFFDDGGVHEIDYTIDDGVVVIGDNDNGSTTAYFLPGSSVEGILWSMGTSRIVMSDGSIASTLLASDNSVVTVSGGTFGHEFWLGDRDDCSSTVAVTGTDFKINGEPVDYGLYTAADYPGGQLSGNLQKGGELDNTFVIRGDSRLILAPAPIKFSTITPAEDEIIEAAVYLLAEIEALEGAQIEDATFTIRSKHDENGEPVSLADASATDSQTYSDDGESDGFGDVPATYNENYDEWELDFDSAELPNGHYIFFVSAVDTYGNEGVSKAVPFKIENENEDEDKLANPENWEVVELLPPSPRYNPGRTLPVRFALQVKEDVDAETPFVYSEHLEVRIRLKAGENKNPLQSSFFGRGRTAYRINEQKEYYVTNFRTLLIPAEYIVEVRCTANDLVLDSFEFETERRRLMFHPRGLMRSIKNLLRWNFRF